MERATEVRLGLRPSSRSFETDYGHPVGLTRRAESMENEKKNGSCDGTSLVIEVKFL